jgi:hypothetical protein
MARQRADDLDEEFEVSLGFSDMEKEDAEAIDRLADLFAPVSIDEPPIQELRLVPYRKPIAKRKKVNLRRLVKRNKLSKCPTSAITPLSSLSSLLSPMSTSRPKQ